MERFRIAENRLFDVDGRSFLFLVRENAIFEVAPKMKTLLDWRSSNGDLSRDELLARIGRSPEDNVETFEGLVRRRVIEVSAEKAASPARPQATRVSIPISTLVLHVTDDCNMGCLYCYRPPREKASNRPAEEKRMMTPEVADQAIDFLFEHSGSLKKMALVFFGGEPFLNFNLIRVAVKYARQKAEESGKQIDFAVTTNGTLLTDTAIRFIRENEIGVTVSIDGFEKAHDRYRRFADGSPSYGAIIPNVRELIQVSDRRPVVARMTVAGSPEDVPVALDHLLEMGFAEVGFAPVTTCDPSYQLDDDCMKRLLGQFSTLSGRFLSAAARGDFFGFSNLIDMLVALHEGEVKSYPCGAGLGLFSVDPEGRLYLCQRLTGEERFCMGDLTRGLDDAKLRIFRGKAEASRKEACGSCWARTVCAGGCYHESLVREGDLTAPNLHYCEWIKSWLEMGLQVYGRMASICPEYLDKLSILRGHVSA
jgi:uncharacterized protein